MIENDEQALETATALLEYLQRRDREELTHVVERNRASLVQMELHTAEAAKHMRKVARGIRHMVREARREA